MTDDVLAMTRVDAITTTVDGATHVKGFGWRPDLPDWRDLWRDPRRINEVQVLPDSVRLDQTPAMPPVYDQGQLGSCTANGLAAAVEFDLRKQGLLDFVPSRLFIYYNERVIEHTTSEDAGAEIRDGAKTIHKLGVCPETSWPYDIRAFAQRPPAAAYADALNTKSVRYARVARKNMRQLLASGVPFTIGFTVYDSFYNIGDNGIMPMPSGSVLGGHAVLVCGYANINGELYYLVRNSWGNSWGMGGYFWMPAGYILNPSLSQDFWAIETVS